MTSPEAALRTILMETPATADVVGQRIYPVLAPTTAELPFVVYRREGVSRMSTIAGPSGKATVMVGYMIIDTTYEKVRHVASLIAETLDGWAGIVNDTRLISVHLSNEMDNFAELTGAEMPTVYSVSQTYDVIYEENSNG